MACENLTGDKHHPLMWLELGPDDFEGSLHLGDLEMPTLA
jgi:hypothetical protein